MLISADTLGKIFVLFSAHILYVFHRRFVLSTHRIFEDFSLTNTDIEMVGYNPEDINQKEITSGQHSEAGLVSGVVTRAIIQPLDVLKIRFQLQEEPIGGKRSGKYRGVAQSIGLIWREEGLAAFWKGHVPAQGLSAIFGIVQFTSYERLSRMVGEHMPKAPSDFICGGLSGSLAMTAAMPLDVIRTRLVAQTSAAVSSCEGKVIARRRAHYQGTLHAMKKIAQNEGVQGFFRGWNPSVAQVAPYTGLSFWFYNSIGNYLDERLAMQETMRNFVAGAAAGATAKTVLYPLDMVRHRLQMNGFRREQTFGKTSDYSRGLVRTVLHIFRVEGLRGFSKGLWPSQLKAAANSGCTFFFYEMALEYLKD